MTLSEVCVRRPVFATTLVVTLVVLGLFSFRDLGVDLFPKADPATVNITVQLPGASPSEIATSVVEPLVDDVDKLNAHRLSIDQVRDALQKENVEVPGGFLEQGKSQIGLRTLGRIDATEQFNNIIVTTVSGTPVRISDVGYAEDAVERVT